MINMSHAGWQHKKGSLISLCLWPEQTINFILENKTLFNNTSNTKLYSDKKGVSYAKNQGKET